MRYDKYVKKTDGRQLYHGGPRDMQRKQSVLEMQNLLSDQSEVIGVLKRKITELEEELSNQPKNRDNYTPEELDEEVNRELTKVIKELENKYKNEIDSLKQSLESKNDLLKEKDARISELKQLMKGVVVESKEINDVKPERPKFEEVFIDPLEKGAGSKLESHIKIKEDRKKENIADKSDKLRKIFGNKPNRR